MTESTGSTKGAKKGGKGKLTSGQKAGLAVGGAVVVYFLYRYYQNSQASASTASSTPSSQIDPLTGQPYASGVGSLAPGASGSTSGIDPATGQSYSSEIASLGGGQQSISSELSTLAGDITSLGSTTPGGNNTTVSPAGATVPNEGQMLQAWRANAIKLLQQNGLTAKEAGQQVALYLEGKQLTNLAATRDLTNIVKNSPPPLPSGTVLHLPVLAKSATQTANGPSHAATTGVHTALDPIRRQPPTRSTASTQPRPAPHPSGNVGQAAPTGHAPTIAVPHQAAVG